MTTRNRITFFAFTAVLAVGTIPAQDLRLVKFKGLINDYSPSTVPGGPYEIRGEWSAEMQRGGTANFTADVNMITSDAGVNSAAAVDPANPATRGAHNPPRQYDERGGDLRHERLPGLQPTHYWPGHCR